MLQNLFNTKKKYLHLHTYTLIHTPQKRKTLSSSSNARTRNQENSAGLKCSGFWRNSRFFLRCFTSFNLLIIPQPAVTFTCLKLTIETLEQGVKICSKLAMKTPERRYWGHYGIFIVNFEHISHLVLVFLLLTSSR